MFKFVFLSGLDPFNFIRYCPLNKQENSDRCRSTDGPTDLEQILFQICFTSSFDRCWPVLYGSLVFLRF